MIWPMGLVQTLLPPPCWQRLCDRSFYLCIILWAGLVKSNEPISLKLGVMIEPNLINWLTFGAAPVSDTDSASVFHFPQHCRIVDLRRFISISRADHQPIFTKLGKMTRTRQWIHYIFAEVRHTSRSRLIRQCGLEYQITLGWNVGIAGGLWSVNTVLLMMRWLGVRQRVAGFMHQSPLDGNVTRRVKMAANVIDRFGFDLCYHLCLTIGYLVALFIPSIYVSSVFMLLYIYIIIIIIIIITDLYSAFRSKDTEALDAAQED